MATIPEQYESQRVGVQGYRVLNLDLDGVCADYKGAIRDYLQRQGIDVPERALQTAHSISRARTDGRSRRSTITSKRTKPRSVSICMRR